MLACLRAPHPCVPVLLFRSVWVQGIVVNSLNLTQPLTVLRCYSVSVLDIFREMCCYERLEIHYSLPSWAGQPLKATIGGYWQLWYGSVSGRLRHVLSAAA